MLAEPCGVALCQAGALGPALQHGGGLAAGRAGAGPGPAGLAVPQGLWPWLLLPQPSSGTGCDVPKSAPAATRGWLSCLVHGRDSWPTDSSGSAGRPRGSVFGVQLVWVQPSLKQWLPGVAGGLRTGPRLWAGSSRCGTTAQKKLQGGAEESSIFWAVTV